MKKICLLIIFSLWILSLIGQTTDADSSTNEISFYPNPAKYFITISEPAHVVVINIVGKTVVDKITVREKERIDISNLPEGVYFIKIDEGPLKRFKISRS